MKFNTKVKYFYLISFIMTLATTSAQEGTSWEYIGNYEEGGELYVKIENSSSSLKEAWVKMTNPVKLKKTKSGKTFKSGGGYYIAYWTVNCEDKTYSLSNRMTYDRQGKATAIGDEYNDPKDERIIPDTVGETIFNNICR